MQRRKLIYVPGLISLIGLPLLLFVFGPSDKKEQTVLTINLPSDDTINTLAFSKASTSRMLKGKKIEKIILDDIVDDDDDRELYLSERKQNYIQSEMERLQFTHDTDRVLKIKLTEENTYGQYISLINFAAIYRCKRYIYIDDAFYFFANEPPCVCGGIEPLYFDSYPINQPAYEPPGMWTIFYWRMEAKWQLFCFEIQDNKLLSIGFVVLIFIPFLLKLVMRKKLLHFRFSV